MGGEEREKLCPSCSETTGKGVIFCDWSNSWMGIDTYFYENREFSMNEDLVGENQVKRREKTERKGTDNLPPF